MLQHILCSNPDWNLDGYAKKQTLPNHCWYLLRQLLHDVTERRLDNRVKKLVAGQHVLLLGSVQLLQQLLQLRATAQELRTV